MDITDYKVVKQYRTNRGTDLRIMSKTFLNAKGNLTEVYGIYHHRQGKTTWGYSYFEASIHFELLVLTELGVTKKEGTV
ncbi:MAG: hypothetical protein E6780_03855 [Staphylococcus epidermidis]|nr:hypothetical protein [Staphylococcus epidermidis]